MRKKWSDAEVERVLLEASASLGGRMPSANELRAIGQESITSRIVRTGGFRHWSERLGLRQKQGSGAHEFGERWEVFVHGLIVAMGWKSELQRRHAPFDILVDGRIRIDVKASKWHDYGAVRGFTFWLGESWQRCDAFALVKVSDGPPEVLWVPSSEAQQQTITLTGKHRLNACTDMAAILRRTH